MYPNTVSWFIPKSYWNRNRSRWLVSMRLLKLPKLRPPPQKNGGEEFLTSWATTWLLWWCLLQMGEVSVARTWKCEPTRWRVKRKTASPLPATIIRANQFRNTGNTEQCRSRSVIQIVSYGTLLFNHRTNFAGFTKYFSLTRVLSVIFDVFCWSEAKESPIDYTQNTPHTTHTNTHHAQHTHTHTPHAHTHTTHTHHTHIPHTHTNTHHTHPPVRTVRDAETLRLQIKHISIPVRGVAVGWGGFDSRWDHWDFSDLIPPAALLP